MAVQPPPQSTQIKAFKHPILKEFFKILLKEIVAGASTGAVAGLTSGMIAGAFTGVVFPAALLAGPVGGMLTGAVVGVTWGTIKGVTKGLYMVGRSLHKKKVMKKHMESIIDWELEENEAPPKYDIVTLQDLGLEQQSKALFMMDYAKEINARTVGLQKQKAREIPFYSSDQHLKQTVIRNSVLSYMKPDNYQPDDGVLPIMSDLYAKDDNFVGKEINVWKKVPKGAGIGDEWKASALKTDLEHSLGNPLFSAVDGDITKTFGFLFEPAMKRRKRRADRQKALAEAFRLYTLNVRGSSRDDRKKRSNTAIPEKKKRNKAMGNNNKEIGKKKKTSNNKAMGNNNKAMGKKKKKKKEINKGRIEYEDILSDMDYGYDEGQDKQFHAVYNERTAVYSILFVVVCVIGLCIGFISCVIAGAIGFFSGYVFKETVNTNDGCNV